MPMCVDPGRRADLLRIAADSLGVKLRLSGVTPFETGVPATALAFRDELKRRR